MQTPCKFSVYSKIKFRKIFPHWFQNNLVSYSSLSNISRENFIPFELMIENRRKEARKSVVVEIQQKEHLQNLQSICSVFGNIKKMLEFKPSPKKHMCIIEFEEESSLKEIIHAAQMNTKKEIGGIHLPFLKIIHDQIYSQPLHPEIASQPLLSEMANELSTKEIVNDMKYKCTNISEQIQYFYDNQKMTEVGWRLRFLTCRKIEWVLPGILSHIKVLPFGSSVNTFGNHNCDLDMIVDFSKGEESQKLKDFPLIIQPGKEKNSSRSCVQRNLEVIADLMSFYMPGFSQIIKILHASVPIIKCNEMFTGLECDITVSNKSGFYMSELLYLYGCSDPRVRPLVFCVRWWAKQKNLTQKMQPGRWFSNFTTTLLVLFFLMNTNSPVIPPVQFLSGLSDKAFTLEGISYKFVRDVSRLPVSSNSNSMEQLLRDFFAFYSEFDFKKNAISIVTGKAFPKPNYSALYVQNPIEKELNVSKNINLEELEMFKAECIIAVNSFQQMSCKNDSTGVWGLVSLVTKPTDKAVGHSKRIFDIDLSHVFNKNEHASLDDQNAVPVTYTPNPPRMMPKKKKKISNNRRYPPTFKFT